MPYARDNVPLMFVIAMTRICTCAQGSDAHWRPAHTVSRFSPSYPYELDRELDREWVPKSKNCPSLACYRWITKLVISATGYTKDAQYIAGLPGGVVAKLTSLVIQR